MESLGRATLIFDALSSTLRCEIFRYIKKKKLIHFEGIRREFNLNNNTLSFHLNKLQNAGVIQQTRNRGPYEISKLGTTISKILQRIENLITDL